MTKSVGKSLERFKKCTLFLIANTLIGIISFFPLMAYGQDVPTTHQLTIMKAGNGSGTVASAPAGIVCDPICSTDYPKATVISLKAAPWSGSTLAGWSGCDTISGNDCTVSMNTNRTVTATFTTAQPTLLLDKTGNGNGQVISSPPGVNCDPVCIATFNKGTIVTLTALPAPGSLFGDWTGCDSSFGSACTITLSGNKSVRVRFNPKPITSYSIMVNKAGLGVGTVTSTPSGVSCALDCPSISNTFTSGMSLMLSATPLTSVPTAISTFGGWRGCDATFANHCIVTMESHRTVTVVFDMVKPTLVVNKSGNGNGIISSTPMGIKCGTSCVAEFQRNTTVTLAALPSMGSVFSGWSGCDLVSENRCTVSLKADQTVAATFNAVAQKTLIVKKTGVGLGRITSNERDPLPQAINCGAVCQAAYLQGTTISLTATPAEGSFLSGWTGCDTVSGRVCTLTLSTDRTVTVNFSASTLTTLSIHIKGTGSGKVTGPRFLCDPTCVSLFSKGTVVNLNATPLEGSTLAGWSGCDTISGKTCNVTLNSDRSVTATFNSSQVYLTVKVVGTSSGKVTGTGINCDPLCAAVYTKSTIVTLNASALEGSMLSSWSGCDTISGKTCSVTLNSDRTVTATFDSNRAHLAILLKGNGSGKVTGKSIVCDPICAAVYPKGTTLVLTGTPSPNSTLVGWTGCDTVTATTCTVTLSSDKTVSVTFNKKA